MSPGPFINGPGDAALGFRYLIYFESSALEAGFS